MIGFLDPDQRVPAEDIRPNQLFHGVKHAWIADQVIQPLEQKVPFERCAGNILPP